LYFERNVARGVAARQFDGLGWQSGGDPNRRAAERMLVKRLLRLKCARIVVEATGGYETLVVAALQAAALSCRKCCSIHVYGATSRDLQLSSERGASAARTPTTHCTAVVIKRRHSQERGGFPAIMTVAPRAPPEKVKKFKPSAMVPGCPYASFTKQKRNEEVRV
jgi:hypothetical protein